MSSSRIADVMTPKVVEVPETHTLAQLIGLFESERISGAPVVDSAGKAVGVVSKTDVASSKLLKLLAAGKSAESITVKDLMNPNLPVSITEERPIDDALSLMLDHQVHRVFVTSSEGTLTGIISTFDIVRFLRFSFESWM